MKFGLSSKKIRTAALLCGTAIIAGPAFADGDGEEEHFDIGAWNDNGVLVTGGWDHDTESLEVANLRVFEAHFGEDPAFPNAIDEPGIGGVAAVMGFDEGATLSMNMFSGAQVWNGSGFESTSALLKVDYGPASMNSGAGGSLDFLITDDYDLHPIFSIDPAAASGSYLLEFTMSMDGLQTSESLWIVFNFGLDDELYEESVDWVADNLAPAPGVLAMLAIAGAPIARRRRRNG